MTFSTFNLSYTFFFFAVQGGWTKLSEGIKKLFILCRGKCIADRYVLLYSNIKHNQCFFPSQSSERVRQGTR